MDLERQAAEHEIFVAAKKVFMAKGFLGTSMRDIAAEAGVNPAMVNYYYRSKERLFELIFDEAFSTLISRMGKSVFAEQSTIFEKIESVVFAYVDTVDENPQLPAFVLGEVLRNPKRVLPIFRKREEIVRVVRMLDQELRREAARGVVRYVAPMELCVNIISLSVFPVLMHPILGEVADVLGEDLDTMQAQRKQRVACFVINAIKL